MSSPSALSSLGLLQATLAQALNALSPETSRQALEGLRQIPDFRDLSDLNDLISGGRLARMASDPLLFRQVAHILEGRGESKDARPSAGPRAETLIPLPDSLTLREGVQIYGGFLAVEGGSVDLGMLGRSMSRVLKDELAWPEAVDLDSLGNLAVSVRRAFDVRRDHLLAGQRYNLIQVSVCLDAIAGGLCAFVAPETGKRIQARKLAALIETLYGCGYGDEGWTEVSESLRRLWHAWDRTPAGAREEGLRRHAAPAVDMVKEAGIAFETFLDPMIREYARLRGLGDTDIQKLLQSLSQGGSRFELGRHLAALGV